MDYWNLRWYIRIIAIKMSDLNKLLKDSSGFRYKYPNRSCSNCSKYPCFLRMDNLHFDFAKYGCSEYKES